MKHLLACLLAACPLLAEGPDLPRLVAALGDDSPEVVAEAQRELLIAGPDALALLRRAAEDEISRLESLTSRVPELVRDLDAEDVRMREGAEKGLIDVGVAALPALREVASKGSPEAKARARHAINLIRSGTSTTLPRLGRLAEAIGAQADDACVPILLALGSRMAAPDSSPAIDGLWRLATPAAKAALQTLAADADVERRWSARAALLELGESPPGKLEDFVKEWPPAPLRKRVASALHLSELPEVVPVAMAAWEKEEDSEVSQEFWSVLDGSADVEALTTCALRALATCPVQKRRWLPPLIRHHTPESEKALLALIDDPDEKTREAAAAQLLPLLGDDAVPHVLALLEDPADGMLAAALPSLHVLIDADPAPFLEALRERHAYGALEPALVRSEGADEARRIPERWGSLTPEETALLERLASPLILPAFSEAFSNRGWSEYDFGTSTVLRTARRILAGSPPPDPRVHVQQTDTFAESYRRLRAMTPDGRRDLLRPLIRQGQLQALQAAVLLDVDGLEEEVLPLLQGKKGQQVARGYLAVRKTPELLERVREMASGGAPDAAAALWVDWEGRPAVEALLARLKGGTAPPGVLDALATAPLRPEDAAILLATRPYEASNDEPRAWVLALMRTGAPEALREAAEIALSDEKLKYRAEEAYELLLREARPLAVRIARASTRPAQECAGAHWARALADVPCPEAADLLIRLLDAEPMSAEWFARALAQGDPAKAREAAAARRASRHIAKRIEALWIDLCLGERPSPEEIEGMRFAGTYFCGSGLKALALHGETRDLHPMAELLCHPDPGLRLAAFWTLELATAHALDDMRNDLFIPRRARDAWKAWLDAHVEARRSELLDQAIREAGLGEGVEGRIRACAEGPFYLAGAALVMGGWGYTGLTSDHCLWMAEAWKRSLRSK